MTGEMPGHPIARRNALVSNLSTPQPCEGVGGGPVMLYRARIGAFFPSPGFLGRAWLVFISTP